MQIFPNMTYRHYSGGIYRAIMPVRNEANNQAMWVYQNVETGERWVRPESEFAAKFQPHLPFGTKLLANYTDFVVIRTGVDYYVIYCDDTENKLELKLLDVKKYIVHNHVVVQMATFDNATMYQFVLNLEDL